MTRDGWFRNTTWNDDIAAEFERKLKRARMKSQYLRIQGCILATSHPRIALGLLARYFKLGDDFDHAQAYVDCATAYLAVGDMDAAIGAYEAALERERAYPRLRTGAHLDLPYLIALNNLDDRFDQAFEILAGSEDRLAFPVDRFRYHASKAIMLAGTDPAAARTEARSALEAASLDHSGFRYHPRIGLVSARHEHALSMLRRLCDA